MAIIALIFLANRLVGTMTVPASEGFMASSTDASSQPSASIIIKTLNGPIQILVADTPAQMEKGLGGRDSLPQDTGMLFTFPTEGRYGFWMKDMIFPIDIVWIGSNKKIIGISGNLSPETYPGTFYPPSNIQYVLELNAGAADKFGLVTGTAMNF